MPELRFQLQWPDGTLELCYSPSFVIKKYLVANQDYDLADFVDRVQVALTLGSDRVQAASGRPCGLALGQLQQLQHRAQRYADLPNPKVRVLQFIE